MRFVKSSGSITISRLQGGIAPLDECMWVRILDDQGKIVAEVRMTAHDFAMALTGMAQTPCSVFTPDSTAATRFRPRPEGEQS